MCRQPDRHSTTQRLYCLSLLPASEQTAHTHLPSASHCFLITSALRLDRTGGRNLFGATFLNCNAASPSRRRMCDIARCCWLLLAAKCCCLCDVLRGDQRLGVCVG